MNEKALIYIFVFLMMTVMSKIVSQRFLAAVYESAGLSMGKVTAEKLERKMRKEPRLKVYRRLMEVSPEPEKTKRKYIFYQLLSLPPLLCAVVSVIGCFTTSLNGFLDGASLAMIAYMMAVALVGLTR